MMTLHLVPEKDLPKIGNPALMKIRDSGYSCEWANCDHKIEKGEGTLEQAMFEHVMASHSAWITTTPEKVILCNYGRCGRFFVDKTKFADHIRSHTGYKNVTCTEAGCAMTFANNSQMRFHYDRQYMTLY